MGTGRRRHPRRRRDHSRHWSPHVNATELHPDQPARPRLGRSLRRVRHRMCRGRSDDERLCHRSHSLRGHPSRLSVRRTTQGPIIRSVGCFAPRPAPRPANPTSDHPLGKGCDFFPGEGGRFARGVEIDNGWRAAEWFQLNAAALQVSYIIWQGRIWSPSAGDQGGWGVLHRWGRVRSARFGRRPLRPPTCQLPALNSTAGLRWDAAATRGHGPPDCPRPATNRCRLPVGREYVSTNAETIPRVIHSTA